MLYYGLVEPNGEMQVDLFYDHRVMDGVEVFRILRDAEATMNRDILAELTRAPAAP
jgi:pyruvate/2-oxoglutarate dehydrogenase complex dihydrolipoamide acyltransferase (E2) component